MIESFENEILIGLIGIIGVYVLLRYASRDKDKSKPDMTSKILNEGKYKVKGQWEK